MQATILSILVSWLLSIGQPYHLSQLVGGKPASDDISGIFIWTDSVNKLDDHYCTAAKVREDTFLTAAHCLLRQKAMDREGYIGPWRSLYTMNTGKPIKYSTKKQVYPTDANETLMIKSVQIHPSLRKCMRTTPNATQCSSRVPVPDVAIVQVEPNGSFKALDTLSISTEQVHPQQKVILTGYGIYDGEKTTPPQLRFHESTVSDPKHYCHLLRKTNAVKDGYPNKKHFFTILGHLNGDRYANLGGGDSGGPVLDAKTKAIVGINSDAYCPLGYRDCYKTSLSFFTRINHGAPYFVGEWLEENLNK